jgi:HTH-type transcriptional regulator/antitoxin MqsA
MKEARGRLSARINGEDVAIADATHMRCPRCREVLLRYEDWMHLDERAQAAYREKFGLLSAADIRALREKLGLTQAQLAHLLRLGGNTVSRWEAGRNVQTAAMDALLRIVRDVPASLKYLQARAG